MDANPEAPADAVNGQNGSEELGAVAGTLYAKAWILDLLVQLVKFLEGNKSNDEDDDELDSQLVKLWDVSTEPAVACYLAQNQVVDVLLPACLNASVESASRQVEIALGVLANAVSIRETNLADEIAISDYYRQAVIGLFSAFSADSDVLIQCCRLLNACLHCHPSHFAEWENFLLDLLLSDDDNDAAGRNEFSLPEFFIFVLKNSRNEQVLLDVAKLAEILCGSAGRFLNFFAASERFVTAVNEALRELNWSPQSETVCRLINVLYMVSTVDRFRSEFGSLMTTDKEDVTARLASFVLKHFPEEAFEVEDISCALASSLSLLLTVLTLVSVANFPLLFQQTELWDAVGKVYRLLVKRRFDAEDEQSPAAVLKLNAMEFVEVVRSTLDVNVEQYVLNKIISG